MASPHAHPGKRHQSVRDGPAANRPPLPLTTLPSAASPRRLPFTAAPDALHPPGSQAGCPGQGAANNSSGAQRNAAAMAPKRAAVPARPPSCSGSAVLWQPVTMATGQGGKRCRRRLTARRPRPPQPHFCTVKLRLALKNTRYYCSNI